MNVYLYVEGGAKGNLVSSLRKGFRLFFEKTALRGTMPHIVACGPRQDAFKRFRKAIESGEQAVLLVDSECQVVQPASRVNPWQHVKERKGDGWVKPGRATDDDLHFMIECMEAWFLADKEALARYFGSGFRKNHLPKTENIESVNKNELFRALKRATKESRKGEYRKGRDSFELLQKISPDQVFACSPFAKRLIASLEQRCIRRC